MNNKDGRIELRMMKKIYHIHHMKLSCHLCFSKPSILNGECRHQKRCQYCSNQEEKERRLIMLERKNEKCQSEKEKEKLEKMIDDIQDDKIYKPS